jgi:hypothetical protein
MTLAALAAPVSAAEKAKCPYETTVETETYVRSGPGSKYYPTGKLRPGEKVVVHRQDPGGWFMIAPPPGSFSWVPAKYVQKTDPARGTITTNNVVVRVGSFESDIREIFQQKLSRGDDVQILDEKTLEPDGGSGAAELWLKIRPPRGEWRWISGQAVAPPQMPSDGGAGEDPFDGSSRSPAKRLSPPVPRADDDGPSFEKPIADPASREYLESESRAASLETRPLVRKQSKPSAAGRNRKQEAVLDELDRLDARFRSILDKPSLEWDFGQLAGDYRALRTQTDNSNIEQMIDTRLDRIARYEKTRGEDQELARFREEIEQRDAELAELQRRQEAQLSSLRQPRFDGAGIIDRSSLDRRGAPRYVLLAPGGRVLAYLAPGPGINLEVWLGRQTGVYGRRLYHPDLKADLITVNRLAPVRLIP